MKRGFSIVELLVVISIIAILAALAFPALGQVREASSRTRCTSNLRQIAMAISMYRAENDGDGVYGPMYAMGLPPGLAVPEALNLELSPSKPEHIGVCHGPGRPSSHVPWGFHYFYAPRPGPSDPLLEDEWNSHVLKHYDGAILFMDVYHNPAFTAIEAEGTTKFGIGIRLGGHVTRTRGRGDALSYQFWSAQ